LPSCERSAPTSVDTAVTDAVAVRPDAENYADRYDVRRKPSAVPSASRYSPRLDALPEEYRTVLTLCDLEDVPHADAAPVLNKSVAATKSLLYRARRALRDALKDLWDETI
jgi:RNA polymerase sigma-70 factor (ECF subfamily)